ncbi:MAG: CvpA family protein [Bacteroidetes bacterium]|nr:CvpA family protein [Bacteroidota bacterium]
MISALDIILIVVLIAFAMHGFSKGFFSKVFSLLALLAGIYIAAKESKPIASFVGNMLGTGEMVSIIIGLIVVFAALFMVAALLAKGFRKVPILQIWDKLGGAIFGVLEGAMFLSLLFLFLSLFDIPANGPSLKKSFLYQPLKGFAGLVYKTFTTRTSAEKYMDKFFDPGSKRASKGKK